MYILQLFTHNPPPAATASGRCVLGQDHSTWPLHVWYVCKAPWWLRGVKMGRVAQWAVRWSSDQGGVGEHQFETRLPAAAVSVKPLCPWARHFTWICSFGYREPQWRVLKPGSKLLPVPSSKTQCNFSIGFWKIARNKVCGWDTFKRRITFCSAG